MQFDIHFMSDHTLKIAYEAGTVWQKILVAMNFFLLFAVYLETVPSVYSCMFAYVYVYMYTHSGRDRSWRFWFPLAVSGMGDAL